jgi:hypothetical protein
MDVGGTSSSLVTGISTSLTPSPQCADLVHAQV